MKVKDVPSTETSRPAHTGTDDHGETEKQLNGNCNGWTNGDVNKEKSEESPEKGREMQTRRHEPFIFVRWVANRPRLCFGIVLGVHLTFLLITVILFVSGYDVFPVNFETVPVELHDEPWLKRDLAWQKRDGYANRVVRSPPANQSGTQNRGRANDGLLLFYNAGSGNIFTKATLQKMQEIEDALVSIPEFSNYCQLQTPTGPCVPPASVLRFFDGTYASVDPVFYDTTFSNVGLVLYAAYTNNQTKSAFMYALGKNHLISPTSVTSTLTRTVIPLSYSQSEYGVTAFTEFMTDHMQHILDSFLDVSIFEFTYYNTRLMYHDVQQQAYNDMALAIGSMVFIFLFILFHTRSLWVTCMAELSIISSFVEANLFYRVVLDFRYFGYFHVLALFIILGIGADDLFVFWDAWIATGLKDHPSLTHRLNEAYRKSAISMLVTSLTTMMAFVANALSPLLATRSFGIFAAILVGIDYLSVITFFPTVVILYHLHFEDKPHPCCCCWGEKTEKGKTEDPSLENDREKLNVATITTCTFFSSGVSTHSKTPVYRPDTSSQLVPHDINPLSPKPPSAQLRLNGLSNGHLVKQDARGQLVGQGTKTNLVRKDTKSQLVRVRVSPESSLKNSSLNGFALKPNDVRKGSSPNKENATKARRFSPFGPLRSKHVPKGNNFVTCTIKMASRCKSSDGRNRLVVFFGEYYFTFVTHPIARWIIVVALLGCLVGFAYSASRLETDDEQIFLFKDSHHYTKAIKHNNDGFVPHDVDQSEAVTIHIVWGLREQDLSSCHFSEVECTGTQVFDDNFQPNTQAAQQAFVNFCDALFNLTPSEADSYRIKRNIITGELEVACFPRNMEAFLKSDPVSLNVDVSMPWNWTETLDFMTSLNTYYDTTAFNSSFTQYLDIPLTYWLWNAFQQNNTEDKQLFDPLVGEEKDTFSTNITTSSYILIGNKLKYLAIAVNTTLYLRSLGYEEGIPVIERWEQFMKDQLSTMPAEMQGGFQTTYLAWHWVYVQKALADNAILGIVIGVSLAFPVLVLSTSNIVNGFLATVTICCVTVCVIGVVPLGGWKLGVLVSLNMCLVTGLAVDFVVHLAESYHMSHLTDRHGRLKEALERMGISIFSGACTTLGASAFMLFAQIQFFFQFGIFMFCTIGFSLLFSMGLYVTVMGIIGPQGDFGDIRVLARKCWARVRPSKKTGGEPASDTANGAPPLQTRAPVS